MSSVTRLGAALHVAAGLSLAGAAGAIRGRPELAVHLNGWTGPLFAGGLISFVLAFIPVDGGWGRVRMRVCLAVIVGVLGMGTLEVGFRLARFDFRRQAARLQRLPPFYCRPTVPLGSVFFRRAGPLVWTGPVIATVLRAEGLPVGPYANVLPVTVRYDEHGFRNEVPLTNWVVAVAGDSFTELGTLPYSQLFTTRVATRLGCPVSNLGVSNTGPLSYLEYLRNFGTSVGTTDWMVMFYEGNDLADLTREFQERRRFAGGGPRPDRRIRPQTSFLRAMSERLRSADSRAGLGQLPVDARLRLGGGATPVTLAPPPPGRDGISRETSEALRSFLDEYRDLSRARGVRAWLVYLPCKQRVWQGHLEFTGEATPAMRDWRPTDLPLGIEEACHARNIRFLDATRALGEAMERTGRPLFNTIYDTHLDADGSSVVAEVLGDALAAGWTTTSGPAKGTGLDSSPPLH